MQPARKHNILLVDDRVENLLALESVLSSLGENLVCARSGCDALRELLHLDFAVILMDVQMPGMDGYETATQIRSRERTRYVPIIFLTAINRTEQHVSRGYTVGAVDYVVKPFDPDLLRAKVAAFVELYRNTHALEEEIAHRRTAEAKLDTSNALLETLSRVLTQFISAGDVNEALRELLHHAMELTGSACGYMAEVSRTREGTARTRVLVEEGAEARARRRRGGCLPPDLPDTLLGELGVPLFPTRQEDIRALTPAKFADISTLMVLPIQRGPELVGLLGLANHPGGYDETLASVLQPVASACATVLEAHRNRRRREAAEAEVHRLNRDLERRVEERTAQLQEANQELASEIVERRRVEEERTRLLEREQAARAAAESAQRRLAFLGEASAVLVGSLDLGTTLQRVARLPIPYLGDLCVVQLLDEEGELRAAAAEHADPRRSELLRELFLGPDPLGIHPPAALGVPAVTAAALDRDRLADQLPGDTHMLRKILPTACMAVPLPARGHVIGVLTIGTTQDGAAYSEADLSLAEDLARRAAAAIDNARLFHEIQNAAERKDEFLAMLAHELRNPLAAISYADYALERIGGEDHRVSQLRGIISRQTRHLSSMVEDLLDISRITRGQIELRREPLELSELIRRAVESTRAFVESRSHRLVVTIPERSIWIHADPTRLEQVLANLLNNAAKYTEPGGQIAVWTERVPGRVEIHVRDTGKGIPPEMLPVIFDLFTQVNPAIDRSQGGLGIGLALVRRLLQMHGGTVHATSEGEGQGAEFVVTLPTVAAAQEAIPPPVEESNGVVEAPLHIMVVEDNRDAAETLRDILEMWGHQVSVVHTGGAALPAALEKRPQVMLLDIGLPEMDGYSVARALREEPSLRDLLLVALTGYGQDADRQRSHDAGIDHHLTKPVDPAELRQILRLTSRTPCSARTRSLPERGKGTRGTEGMEKAPA